MINPIEKGQSLKNMEANILQELKGKQLWGDIGLSEDEYDVLRDRIKEVLRYHDVSIGRLADQYPVAVTTLMVFLARYKFNTNYWGLLGKELSITINGPIETELGHIVRSTFKKYGFDFSDVQNERRINLEPIFYEAGLPPESSLDDLFYILNYDSHTVFDPQLIIEDLVEMRSYQIRKPMLKFLKRFKGDRAVEFVMEVHEAMLCVDQSMASDSHYVGNYSEWKTRERSKETISSRKKQEFQTKPYLAFDNGNKGLCLVLPRVLLKDEWIDDIGWYITTDLGVVQRRLNVFGDEGKRFIESISVPVAPSSRYRIELIDEENLEDSKISSWMIEGISNDGFIVFNANGRLITPNYIPYPFGVIVYGNDVSVSAAQNVAFRRQDYPTNRPEYTIQSFESTGRDGAVTILGAHKNITLNTRPQVNMSFSGRTLFSIEDSDEYRLYTEVPALNISIDDGTSTDGLTLRIGGEAFPIDKLFNSGSLRIDLRKMAESSFEKFGTYSIRLYQYDHFIKLVEFTLVPNITSTYQPYVAWSKATDRESSIVCRFQRRPDVQMEFEGCYVSADESEYTVVCPARLGALPIRLDYSSDDSSFTAQFELPVRPFEYEIKDQDENQKESISGKTMRLGLIDFHENEYWASLRFLGTFKHDNYRLMLRTVNGVEQEEALSLTQNGCANKNLSVFYDTLQNCPLPAQIELCRDGSDEDGFPLLIVSDTVQLNKRPGYVQSGFITLSIADDKRNLTVTSFRDPRKSAYIPYEKSVLGKSGKSRGYKCPNKLEEGFYVIESNLGTNAFEFEDENNAWLSNSNDTLYVSIREKGAPIETFSDWLDQLIKDILLAGMGNDISSGPAYRSINTLASYKAVDLTQLDCERLISLAYFINSKCSNLKKRSMERCMSETSTAVLNSKARLEIIKTLAHLQCPSVIFDTCLLQYHLLLFSVGSDDAIQVAGQIENYSTEISMLLRMGADDQIRNTIWREKYRDLIGKEAIKDFLFVPEIEDPIAITEEQRKFLREQPSKVRIRLTPDVSGDMEPITAMIKVTYNKIIFDKAAKPDIGIYFDRIRYVDQYVNWYFSHSEPTWEIKEDTRQAISSVVQEYGPSVMKNFNDVMKIKELRRITERYDAALKARYRQDPLANLKAAIPARFFYLQGLAAYLAKLPKDFQKYGWAVRTGEAFMVKALSIAPRISRRDILMASTYLYLAMKEEQLCQ